MTRVIRYEVLLARHGETQSNRVGRYAGCSSESLTETGCEQARALARRLAGAAITRVRTSGVARAVETATIVAQAMRVPIVQDSRLNEMKMGPWEGLTEPDVEERYPIEYGMWLERPDRLELDNRETLVQVGRRVRTAIVASLLSGHRELLISHVALIRVAILLAEGRSLREYKCVEVPNCHPFAVRVPLSRVLERSSRKTDTVPCSRVVVE